MIWNLRVLVDAAFLNEEQQFYESDDEDSGDISLCLSFFLFLGLQVIYAPAVTEWGVIIITVAAIGNLAVTTAVFSTLDICNWLKMFYLETRYFSSVNIKHDGRKLVENVFK